MEHLEALGISKYQQQESQIQSTGMEAVSKWYGGFRNWISLARSFVSAYVRGFGTISGLWGSQLAGWGLSNGSLQFVLLISWQNLLPVSWRHVHTLYLPFFIFFCFVLHVLNICSFKVWAGEKEREKKDFNAYSWMNKKKSKQTKKSLEVLD